MNWLYFSFLLLLIPINATPAVEDLVTEDGENPVPLDDDQHLAADECECNNLPTALGVESGIITDEQITASSYEIVYTAKKIGSKFRSGWKPQSNDVNPWMTINLGKVMEIHGLGTKGLETEAEPLWVTRYTVEFSSDDVTYTPLVDRITGKPRVFVANSNQDEWKNQCLRGYYGDAPEAQYIRFTLIEHNGNGYGMQIELYGFRDADDEALLKALEKDVWTVSTRGCQCQFDAIRFDCACCEYGAEQCPFVNRHQCVKGGSLNNCGIPEISEDIQDPWTESFTGCACSWDTSRTDCACCKNGGGQCARKNKNQCVQYGLPETCGEKESIFGVNEYCKEVPAHCRA